MNTPLCALRASGLLGLVALLACAAPVAKHQHAEPLSVSEHERHAQAHESEALYNEEAMRPESTRASCTETERTLDSGGERMPTMSPCWTQAEISDAYERRSEAERRAAADHRRWAVRLERAERDACGPMSAEERDTSPFSRGPDILSIAEHREAKTLRGARITFRKVPGLSKQWLVASVRCHQARAAALGFDERFMPHCPLTLPDVQASVEEQDATMIITLRSDTPVVAAEVFGRVLRAREQSTEAPPLP